jgi:formylmethanofuran dehydrogenase subunit B
VLRTLLRGGDLDLAQVAAQTGAPLEQWAYLAQRLKTAQYAALFYEPAAGDPGGPDALSQGITDLVRELHRHTRAAALRLGAPWNAVGAAQVLTWQTGFPSAVSFAPGHPTYLPGEASAHALLERGEVDAALVVGADPASHLSPAARAHLATIPHVVLDDHLNATANSAAVVLFTAKFGVETAGNVFRSDGVALPIKPVIRPTLPDAAALLAELVLRIARSL